ncbi:hypothetical protein ACF3NG_04415 [Aerococcaceae bacterium WGS1372]
MKYIINFFQNPLVKIFISPLASILFGLLIGISQTEQIQWLMILWLYLIIISAQLVDHFLYLKKDKKADDSTPNFLLYIFDGMLIISSVLLMLNSHWIINLLLFFYIVYIHIQYFPFKMTGTLYHFILSVFFNSFILNVIAYNSQTHALTNNFIINTIPIVLMFIALNIEVFNLKSQIINSKQIAFVKRMPYVSLSIGVIALTTGFYLSIPSNSYYITQIIFVIFCGMTMLPLLVNTQREHQAQNKMNYMHAVTVIFAIFYSLSQLY